MKRVKLASAMMPTCADRYERWRTKMLMKLAALAMMPFLFSISSVAAMDRWSALSMLESGNNDRAVGPVGEVSRFQIKPTLWSAAAADFNNPADPCAALAVAQAIMRDRCAAFEGRFHRPPTDFEFYVLWNAPARLIGTHQGTAVPKAVTARAQRFCNLVATQP